MMATQLPALLRTNMGPPPPTPVERAAGEVEKYGTQIAGKLEEQGAFEAEQAQKKAEQLSQQAKQRAEAIGTERKAIEESAPFQDLQRVEKEAAQARFEPTQRSIQENAALFSLIGVIGFAIGAGGKQNAMQAMSGLNGMLKGVQEGDMDRYKQEKATFDTNLKALAQKSNLLTAQLKRITELAARDKERANLELDSLLAQQQADFVKQYKDKYGLPATIKYLEQKQKGAQQMLTLAQRAEDQAMQRARDQEFQRQQQRDRLAFQQELQKQRLETQSQLQQERLEAQAKKGTAGGGALNNRYAFNINEAFAQAAVDLLNVSQMPASTTLGMFAGMTGQSGDTITKSLANTFARKVTPEDSRLMQQIVSGLDQNMARALGGGYANSSAKGVIDAYKQQVSQSGDSAAAQAMFLARMKQELGVLAKAFKNHPGANEGYVADMRDYMNSLEQAIPFSVQQVISANRGNKKTISEKFENLSKQPSSMRLPAVSPSAPVAATPETPAAPAALPPQPAIDALLRGEGTDAQFDEAFGPGAAARARGAK